MPKIEANNDQSFLVDNIPYQRGGYQIDTGTDDLSSTTAVISIRKLGADKGELKKGSVTEWVDNTDTPFATLGDFITYIEPFFFHKLGGGGGISGDIIKSPTEPTDTSKLWFNTNDQIIYYYENNEWLSENLYSVVFNEQGSTPNNTWFRNGNTVGNDLGNGYNLRHNSKIIGISFNRSPGTAQSGNFWLYSNTDTGTNNAAVVTVFNVNTSARGFISPNVDTIIQADKYISMRWNGNQTNNNIVTLFYRRKFI